MAKTFTVSSDKLHPSMPWTAEDQLWIKEFEEKHGVTVDPDNIKLVRQVLEAEQMETSWKKRLGEAEASVEKWRKIKENALSLVRSTSQPTATSPTDSTTDPP